jgi:hypothetical protein
MRNLRLCPFSVTVPLPFRGRQTELRRIVTWEKVSIKKAWVEVVFPTHAAREFRRSHTISYFGAMLTSMILSFIASTSVLASGVTPRRRFM